MAETSQEIFNSRPFGREFALGDGFVAENTARWNRMRLRMLSAAWFTIFVVGALVVNALSIGRSASGISWQLSHVVGVVLALAALVNTLYGYALVGRWIMGSREKELRRRLAAGDVFDLGGYGLTPSEP